MVDDGKPVRSASRLPQLLAGTAALALALYLATARSSVAPKFPPPPYVLRSSRVLLPDGKIVPASVSVDAAGSIRAVVSGADAAQAGSAPGGPFVDVAPLLVMPGLVDPHVHCNSPGRTHWEGFSSASRAAAAGGTTTILDMPLNSVPSTVSLPTLREKVAALAESSLMCDVGLIGGAIPGNADSLPGLYSAGVFAFKSFMVDSQSEDFPHVSLNELSEAMRVLGEIKAAAGEASDGENGSEIFFPPYILHAELPPEGHDERTPYKGSPQSFNDYLASRPESWEVEAVDAILERVETSGCQVHIAHMSSAKAVDRVAAVAKTLPSAGLVSAETCPQFLLWASDTIPDARPEYKCSPPIRPLANQARLWEHLGSTLSMVVSDHSPTDPALKRRAEGNVRGAWGGISGLQYRLQATWTSMLKLDAGASSLEALAARAGELLSGAPARQFGLGGIKGRIAAGAHADFVIWDPEASEIISEENCLHQHKFSPFVGMNLTGMVHWTLLRGQVAFAGPQAKGSNAVSAAGRMLRNVPVTKGDDVSDVVAQTAGVLVQTPADAVEALKLL